MSGWYAVKRGTISHELFAPKGKWSKFEAWSWIVESAAYKETVIDIGGKPYAVPRGALCFSRRFLSTKFGWSEKALATFLRQLENHGAVSISLAKTGNGTASRRTQVSLCNYDKYQSQGTKTGPKGNHNSTKEEQGNNIPVGKAENSASENVVDLSNPNALTWAVGRAYLEPILGKAKSGSIIGKWLKASECGEVLAALNSAKQSGTQDPVPYITEILKNGGKRQFKSFEQEALDRSRRIEDFYLS